MKLMQTPLRIALLCLLLIGLTNTLLAQIAPPESKFKSQRDIIGRRGGFEAWQIPEGVSAPLKDKNVKRMASTLNIAAAKEEFSITTMVEPNSTHEDIEKKLKKPVSVDFNKTPLKDVIKFLTTQLKINVIADAEDIAESNIEVDLDEPITFKSTTLSLSSVLKFILKPLGLTYVVTRECLLITTQSIAEETVTTIVYDVRKLTTAGISEADLMEAIQFSTDGLWADDGEGGGNIIAMPGCLIILQSYHSHKAIIDLLLQLELLIDQSNANLLSVKQYQEKAEKSSVEWGLRSRTVMKPLNCIAAQKIPSVSSKAKIKLTHQKIEKELQKRISVNFIDTPLTDVVKFLKAKHQITIIIDQGAVDEGDLDPEELVNFTAQNIKLENVLTLMLKQFDLTYHIRNESLKITTVAIEEEALTAVVYDVQKLYVAGIDYEFLDLMIYNSTNCLWEDDGEYGGTVTMLPGCLVAKQSFHSHKEIFNLLQQIERFIDRKKVRAAPVKEKL